MPTVSESMDYIRGVHSDKHSFEEGRYLEACETLVDQINDLTESVYIVLPGGRSGNKDARWDKVKAGTEERCGCGNERVIRPGNPRTVYEPSEAGSIIVSGDHKVYLKPLGGDKSSAYVQLTAEDGGLTFLNEPFAPFVFTMDIFSTKGFGWGTLAEALAKQPTPPIFVQGKTKVPIFAINNVDPAAHTVTITPDKAVEVFDPDHVEEHQH